MSVILVLDQDVQFGHFLEADFDDKHCIFACQTWQEALELLNDVRFECILYNPSFSGGDAPEHVSHIKSCQPYSQVVVFGERTIYELEAISEGLACHGAFIKTTDKVRLATQLNPFLEAAIPLKSQAQSGPLHLEQTETFNREELRKNTEASEDTPSRTPLKFNDSSRFNSIL